MNRSVLKVLDDFYRKNFVEGEIVPSEDGNYKILNSHYKNKFGTFILCEKMLEQKDLKPGSSWNIVKGILVNSGNPYEIIGTIHIPGYTNTSGFFVRNHIEDEIVGLSYSETWEVIYKYGARNAEASRSLFPPLETTIINTNKELPPFTSAYWKTPVFNKDGGFYAQLSNLVLREVENAIVGLDAKERVGTFEPAVVQITDPSIASVEVKEVEHPYENLEVYYSAEVTPKISIPIMDDVLKDLKKIAQFIATSEKIVVLTGSGISSGSGIQDYKKVEESLWKKDPFTMADLNNKVFANEPESFWNSFYIFMKHLLHNFTPIHSHESLATTIKAISTNDDHLFFVWLEKQLNKEVTIVTQNVDGLHQKAGSKKVVEYHGNIFECICPSCNSSYKLVNVFTANGLPRCRCGAILRPNVVFFGDEVHYQKQSIEEVKQADLIIVMGTTLKTFPFNELVYHKNEDANLILINEFHVEIEVDFDVVALGDITDICHKLWEEINQIDSSFYKKI
ncbi:SIR2 family NAD-dependent protein deacylase [Ureibacillus manganicus]|uniref:protein acetyllysine N-acetyltransferase n=1 Tax=Ureibacillus manganicus DSM 26584 TaxID=1384049 RepID=A0A0A3HME5_9BACL|nr:Sir2 family NAD-dependent protein deacetylase [Ureibacillus manganicus]KGR73554.1 hypothetical protein CD29_19640 [Ureibacillus manganicus DSM 26584]